MVKSATDVMQEIVFAAVIDSIVALKDASKSLPNTLLRDLNAIHANTTFADLPPALQTTIAASVRSAFARLLKEGYSVAAGRDGGAVRRGPAPPRHGAGPSQRPTGAPPRPPRGDGGKRPPRGGGPGGKPRGPRPK